MQALARGLKPKPEDIVVMSSMYINRRIDAPVRISEEGIRKVHTYQQLNGLLNIADRLLDAFIISKSTSLVAEASKRYNVAKDKATNFQLQLTRDIFQEEHRAWLKTTDCPSEIPTCPISLLRLKPSFINPCGLEALQFDVGTIKYKYGVGVSNKCSSPPTVTPGTPNKLYYS